MYYYCGCHCGCGSGWQRQQAASEPPSQCPAAGRARAIRACHWLADHDGRSSESQAASHGTGAVLDPGMTCHLIYRVVYMVPSTRTQPANPPSQHSATQPATKLRLFRPHPHLCTGPGPSSGLLASAPTRGRLCLYLVNIQCTTRCLRHSDNKDKKCSPQPTPYMHTPATNVGAPAPCMNKFTPSRCHRSASHPAPAGQDRDPTSRYKHRPLVLSSV